MATDGELSSTNALWQCRLMGRLLSLLGTFSCGRWRVLRRQWCQFDRHTGQRHLRHQRVSAPATEVGPATGTISCTRFAPYFGLGLSNAAKERHGWASSADLGVMWDPPITTLNAPGVTYNAQWAAEHSPQPHPNPNAGQPAQGLSGRLSELKLTDLSLGPLRELRELSLNKVR